MGILLVGNTHSGTFFLQHQVVKLALHLLPGNLRLPQTFTKAINFYLWMKGRAGAGEKMNNSRDFPFLIKHLISTNRDLNMRVDESRGWTPWTERIMRERSLD